MSKENSMLALKLLTQEELVHYAYYVGEALAGASKSIEEWVETWKQQEKEIEKLRTDREKLVKALRFYADAGSWGEKPHEEGDWVVTYNTMIPYSDVDYVDDERSGGKLARTTLKELGEME